MYIDMFIQGSGSQGNWLHVPKQSEARSMFPMLLQGDLPLVPELTAVHEAHFNP